MVFHDVDSWSIEVCQRVQSPTNLLRLLRVIGVLFLPALAFATINSSCPQDDHQKCSNSNYDFRRFLFTPFTAEQSSFCQSTIQIISPFWQDAALISHHELYFSPSLPHIVSNLTVGFSPLQQSRHRGVPSLLVTQASPDPHCMSVQVFFPKIN